MDFQMIGSRVPQRLSGYPRCQGKCKNVTLNISYAVIQSESKVIGCLRNDAQKNVLSRTLSINNSRFPPQLVSIKCKKDHKPLTTLIDVIIKNGNTLMAKQENFTFGCE